MSLSFSAVLLAGGKSNRMGRDKAFLEIDGVPLWRRQIETLEALRPDEIFIAGPERAAWIDAGYEIVADTREEAGPLAGVVSGLRRCSTPLLLVLAVDLPDMTANYLRDLVASCSNAIGVVPESSDGFEPLSAVYSGKALPIAERLLRAGTYSLQEFVAACLQEGLLVQRKIPSADEQFFRNLNTPGDVSAFAS